MNREDLAAAIAQGWGAQTPETESWWDDAGQPMPHAIADAILAALPSVDGAEGLPASDDDIERWYAAFEKVSGTEAATFQGRAQIFWRFRAALATDSPEPEP